MRSMTDAMRTYSRTSLPANAKTGDWVGSNNNIPAPADVFVSTPERDPVTQAPGLASTVTEFYDAQTSGRRPPSTSRQVRVDSPGRTLTAQFQWAATADSSRNDDDDSSLGGFSKVGTDDFSQAPSSHGRGGRDGTLLSEAVKSIKSLTRRVEMLELYNTKLETSLASSFAKLRSAQKGTRALVEDLRDPYSDVVFRLTPSDRSAILADLEKAVGLDSMHEYVKHSELPAYDFASHAFVNSEIGNITYPGLPPDLAIRLANLEAAVVHPTGAVEQLKTRLKDMEDMQVGKAVSIAGYTFKDSKDVDAWLGQLRIDETYRFALDAKAQLSGCAEDFVSVGEGLANKSAAIKAGFGSYKSARMAATFDMTYPTVMVKPSAKSEDVSMGDIVSPLRLLLVKRSREILNTAPLSLSRLSLGIT